MGQGHGGARAGAGPKAGSRRKRDEVLADVLAVLRPDAANPTEALLMARERVMWWLDGPRTEPSVADLRARVAERAA